jgi:hypothetical protein
LATVFFSVCNWSWGYNKILFNSSSPTVANHPSAMFVYMKQKIQWWMFAKTCNLIGRLEMKSRLWWDNAETLNRPPPEAHTRWTHSEVQPRRYCLGQSAKSNHNMATRKSWKSVYLKLVWTQYYVDTINNLRQHVRTQ